MRPALSLSPIKYKLSNIGKYVKEVHNIYFMISGCKFLILFICTPIEIIRWAVDSRHLEMSAKLKHPNHRLVNSSYTEPRCKNRGKRSQTVAYGCCNRVVRIIEARFPCSTQLTHKHGKRHSVPDGHHRAAPGNRTIHL